MDRPILIMGATSGIGRAAMEAALGQGLPVRAFARSAAELSPRAGLEPWPGDATRAEDVAAALAGSGAVIQALGIPSKADTILRRTTLFSDATRILVQAMTEADVRRLVAVTGFGAGASRAAMSRVERLGHRALLGRAYADKDVQEELITASALDWTIVRPVILTNGGPSGRMRVLRDPASWRNGLVSRADVAGYLVEAVAQGRDIGGEVVLTR